VRGNNIKHDLVVQDFIKQMAQNFKIWLKRKTEASSNAVTSPNLWQQWEPISCWNYV